ncbi:hypothetical protein OG777_17345 [Micromonospora peucetia]|uniref:hypothetical protein n=1 Tax=Micromonospora peucetia TaxID=47871 RepID=UPI002258CCF5|nr:hypothetical protein [Micromonospora peucetia]MCX4388688.1 hypothetical protein [Micromonospora peucetia]
MAKDEDLPLADTLALGKLAYLRQRSLSNPRYRDANYVRLHVTPGYLRWSRPSVFDPHLESVQRSLATFEGLAKCHDPEATYAWRAVLAAVDLLLAEGRHRTGHRIRPRRI